MLSSRILTTFELFALEQLPLTSFELHKFLLNNPTQIRSTLGKHGEVVQEIREADLEYATFGEVVEVLKQLVQKKQLETKNGYYCLPGQERLIEDRLKSYSSGILREKRIRDFLPWLNRLPFIRGIALAGSQAHGPQKPTSDIDLLVITDKQFFWLGRTVITLFLQITGVRRHGKKITNRFCLNHYLSEPKHIKRPGNIYTALEYMKLRPLVGKEVVREFVRRNRKWLQNFFPHAALTLYGSVSDRPVPVIKHLGEWLLRNRFGLWLEKILKQKLRARIHAEGDIVVDEDELLFHHDGKQHELTRKFLALPAFQTPTVIIEEIEIIDIVA